MISKFLAEVSLTHQTYWSVYHTKTHKLNVNPTFAVSYILLFIMFAGLTYPISTLSADCGTRKSGHSRLSLYFTVINTLVLYLGQKHTSTSTHCPSNIINLGISLTYFFLYRV